MRRFLFYWLTLLLLSGGAAAGEGLEVTFRTEPAGAEVWLEAEGRDPLLLGESGERPLLVDPSLVQSGGRLWFRKDGYVPVAAPVPEGDFPVDWSKRRLELALATVTFHTSPRGAQVTVQGENRPLGRAGDELTIDRSQLIDPQTGEERRLFVNLELPDHAIAEAEVGREAWITGRWPPSGTIRIHARNPVVFVRYFYRDHPAAAVLIGLVLLYLMAMAVRRLVVLRDKKATAAEREQRLGTLGSSARAKADPLIGERLGNYRLVELLGGRGEILYYRALPDNTLEESGSVCLRVTNSPEDLDPDFGRDFKAEAEHIRGGLDHPALMRWLEWGSEDGVDFLAMELVQGKPLKVTPGGIPTKRALETLRPVMEGLALAHERGVVHRQLSPDKILVGPSGGSKLRGFAFQGKERQDDRYRPPETLKGEPVTSHADQYALGAILYALLTGQAPTRPPQPVDRLVSGVPRQVARVVVKMLGPVPKARYANLREVLAELDKASL